MRTLLPREKTASVFDVIPVLILAEYLSRL